MTTLARPEEQLPPGYTLVRPLGRGGTGHVYLAVAHSAQVVVKLADPSLDLAQIERLFRREAAIAASLRHPAVAQVFEVGVLDGRPYIVSEYRPGRTLTEVLRDGPLGVTRAAAIGRELAHALAEVHRQGVVHRDVKPGNILVRDGQRAQLIDFGLAARPYEPHTQRSGTLRYGAPEQMGLLRRTVDGRSDLYSLGVVLFECVVGAPPFTSADTSVLLHEHAAVVPPSIADVAPNVDPVFAAIVAKLLRKDPDERYPSADLLVRDLENLDRLRAHAANGEEIVLADPALSRAAPKGMFFGRADPIAALGAILGEPVPRDAHGEPIATAALVTAPHGAGKTRLVEEVVYRRVAPRTPVLRGRCAKEDPYPLAPIRQGLLDHLGHLQRCGEAVRGAAYGALRDAATGIEGILADLDPRLADLLGATGSVGHGGFDNALASFLCAFADASGGAVLWIDDAQWLDDASRRVLAFAQHRLHARGLRLVLCARDDLESERALAGLLDELSGIRFRRLSVPPLTPSEVGLVVQDALGSALEPEVLQRIIAHCQGNPLLVFQYLHALKESGALVPSWGRWILDEERASTSALPTELFDLLVARVGALGPAARDILAAAALLGGTFDLGVLLDVCAPITLAEVQQAVDEARAAQLLDAGDHEGHLRFVHERVREVLAALGEPRAEEVHRRAALHLEATGDRRGRRVFECAWHYLQAGNVDPVAVFRACTRAAERALQEHAHHRARDLLESASDTGVLPQLPASERRAHHHAHGLALFNLQRIAEATTAFRAALAVSTDPIERAETRDWIARTLLFQFDSDAGLREAGLAFAEIGAPLPFADHPDPAALGKYLTETLADHVRTVATTPAGASTAAADRARDAVLVSLCEVLFLAGYYERQPLHALAGGVLALLPAHRLGRSREACSGFATFAMLMGLIGKAEPARRFGALAMSIARELGDRQVLAATQSVVAISLHFLGDVDEALGMQREVFERDRDLLGPIVFQNCCIDLAWNYRARGLAQEELEVALAAVRRLGSSCGSFLAAYACRASANAAAAAAVLGQMSLAHELVAAVRRYRAIVPASRTIPWMSVEGFLVAFHSVQQDFGAGYRGAIERFEAWGIPAERSALHSRHFYLSRAYAELERHLAAPDDPGPLAALRAAVVPLRGFDAIPTVRAHTEVLSAQLAISAGDAEEVAGAAARARALARETFNPWVLFELARAEGRWLTARGLSSAAAHELGAAWGLARQYGWRARQIQIEALFAPTHAVSASSIQPLISSSSGSDEHPGQASRELAQLEGILALSRAMSAVIDPDAQARIALDEIVRQLGAERAYFFTSDGGPPTFWCGRTGDRRDVTRPQDYSRTAIDRAVQSGKAVLVASEDDAVHLIAHSVLAYDLRSVLAAPLHASERLLGVIYAENRLAHGVFTQDQLDLLQVLGSFLATALQTARTAHLELQLKAETERRHVAESLRTTMAAMTATLGLTASVQALVDGLAREVSFARAAVRVTEDGRHVAAAERGMDGALADALLAAEPVRRMLAAAPNGGVVDLRGQVAAVSEPRAAVWPLHARDAVLGHVLLLEDAADPWPSDGLTLAATIVEHAGVLLDNARLFRQVRALAEQDGLTGLLNRREFFRRAEHAHAEAARAGTPYAAIMFDADRFKQFNDQYGHAVGDLVLRRIASVSTRAVDAGALVGRYGGEEFAILLPGAGPREAAASAESLRAAIEATRVPGPGGAPLRITVSVGVAMSRPGRTLEEALAAADAALYQSKNRGRNLVTVE